MNWFQLCNSLHVESKGIKPPLDDRTSYESDYGAIRYLKTYSLKKRNFAREKNFSLQPTTASSPVLRTYVKQGLPEELRDEAGEDRFYAPHVSYYLVEVSSFKDNSQKSISQSQRSTNRRISALAIATFLVTRVFVFNHFSLPEDSQGLQSQSCVPPHQEEHQEDAGRQAHWR